MQVRDRPVDSRAAAGLSGGRYGHTLPRVPERRLVPRSQAEVQRHAFPANSRWSKHLHLFISVTASFDDGGKDADRAKEDSGRSEAQVIDQVDRPTKTIMASVAQVEVGDGAEAARR
jgi:hypothetical protein